MAPASFTIESLETINPGVLAPEFIIQTAIALLEQHGNNPSAYQITCSQISFSQGNSLSVEFGWLAETFPNSARLFNTFQRPVIVEYAAVAIAFLLVVNIANCTVTEVALRGDKADYFLNDRQLMLEVSGTERADQLAHTHNQKIQQLLANPYNVGGYVMVCCFSNQCGEFSFHT